MLKGRYLSALLLSTSIASDINYDTSRMRMDVVCVKSLLSIPHVMSEWLCVIFYVLTAIKTRHHIVTDALVSNWNFAPWARRISSVGGEEGVGGNQPCPQDSLLDVRGSFASVKDTVHIVFFKRIRHYESFSFIALFKPPYVFEKTISLLNHRPFLLSLYLDSLWLDDSV